MSDTPSPAPAPESKPKLTLTPKAPAPAPAPPAMEGSIPPPASPELRTGVGASNTTPPALAAAAAASKPSLKPNFKLQGTPHPATLTDPPAFKSPMPAVVDDSPSGVVVALSFLAAAAAITFAVLLYLKNQ